MKDDYKDIIGDLATRVCEGQAKCNVSNNLQVQQSGIKRLQET